MSWSQRQLGARQRASGSGAAMKRALTPIISLSRMAAGLRFFGAKRNAQTTRTSNRHKLAQDATVWAGAGNGVLDVNHSGIINQKDEVVFSLWDPIELR
jgi:hypothetical protein